MRLIFYWTKFPLPRISSNVQIPFGCLRFFFNFPSFFSHLRNIIFFNFKHLSNIYMFSHRYRIVSSDSIRLSFLFLNRKITSIIIEENLSRTKKWLFFSKFKFMILMDTLCMDFVKLMHHDSLDKTITTLYFVCVSKSMQIKYDDNLFDESRYHIIPRLSGHI